MKKSFLFFPALVLAGILAASCSFNGASSDLSFAVNLPARAANIYEGCKFNYAVYVTGRALPWRGTITKGNSNTITLDNFPLASGNTMYVGFLLAEDTEDTGLTAYVGQTVINALGSGDSVNLSVKNIYANGEFNLPEPKTEQVVTISPGATNNVSTSGPGVIQIQSMPQDDISSEGELYMCSFSYQEVYGNGETEEYGSEIHAECPVWLSKPHMRAGANPSFLPTIKIYNISRTIKITGVNLRRWGEKTGHDCTLSSGTAVFGEPNNLSADGSVNAWW